MTEPDRRDPGREDPGRSMPDWLVVVILGEATALLIALVVPITPGKTGSTWTPAELFWAEPGYLEKVLASFVVVNLLMAGLALVTWISVRRGGSDRRPGE